MKRKFAYFFLTCSLLLIFGHSIFPHNHVKLEHRSCETIQVKALTLSDILQLALAHDLGANHLEEFNNCKPPGFTPRSIQNDFFEVEAYLMDLVVFSRIDKDYLILDADHISKYFFQNQFLRAPPSIS